MKDATTSQNIMEYKGRHLTKFNILFISYPSNSQILPPFNFLSPKPPPQSMSSTAARLLLILSLLSAAAAAADPPSVYDLLQSYGFPAGLLPQGVTSYELDSATGKFSVSIGGSCSYSVNGYDLNYKSTISGTIAKNRITDLNGIQVKILFFWINIIEVTSNGDELQLSVGIASASFPVDNFFECPQCGCGFDCVNSGRRGAGFGLLRRILPIVQYD